MSPDWLFVPRGKRKAEPVEKGGKRLRRWDVDIAPALQPIPV